MERLLLVNEVLDLLRISRPTLDRYIRLAKNGEMQFPLPVQMGAKRKRLWNAQTIEDWAAYRQEPPITPTVAVSSVKQQRQVAKNFNERQQRAAAILAKHGITTNSNQ